MSTLYIQSLILLFLLSVCTGQSLFPDPKILKHTKSIGYTGLDTNHLKYNVTYYYKYNPQGWLEEMNGYDTTTNALIDWIKNSYVYSGDTTFQTGTNISGYEERNYYIKKDDSETRVIIRKDSLLGWKTVYKEIYVDSSGYKIIDSSFQDFQNGKWNQISTNRYYYKFLDNLISQKIIITSGSGSSKNFLIEEYSYDGTQLKTIRTISKSSDDPVFSKTHKISYIIDDKNSMVDSMFNQNGESITYNRNIYDDSGNNLETYRKIKTDSGWVDDFYIRNTYNEDNYLMEFVGFISSSSQAFKVVYSDFHDVSVTGITNNDIYKSLIIYPVPASDFINISGMGTPIQYISIRNQLGSLILTSSINTEEYRLDVSSLKSGIYYIEVATKEGITVKSFVKN